VLVREVKMFLQIATYTSGERREFELRLHQIRFTNIHKYLMTKC